MQNIFKNSFPFSKTAAEHLKDLDIDIREIPTYFPDSIEKAHKYLCHIMDNKELPKEIDISPKSDELLIYAIMRVFVEVINEDILRNFFAEAYSKRTFKLLESEMKKKGTQIILNYCIRNLAINTFNWKLEEGAFKATRKYNWRLRFTNFLEVAPNLMANDWKLINQYLDDGWVFLRTEKINRLIAEKTKNYILNRKISQNELPKLPDFLNECLEDLKSKIKILKEKYEAQKIYSKELMKSAYPPCVYIALEKAEKGENLAHTERLFLTFFLLNIKHTVSDVVDIFRNQPDFKEDMTTYQVEFAAGKRGGGTKYTSFGCPKLISYGICKRELDPWCKEGKVFKKPLRNPLSYYNAKMFLLQKETLSQNKKS